MRVILQDRCWVVHIPFVSMVRFKFLAQPSGSPCRPSCVSPYTPSVLICCANLLHSLIMWLSISSLLLHCLHLLFCYVLSILALIYLVLMALSCTAIRRDSVSLIRFPFLSQVQVFWCEMLSIRRLKWP